MSKHSIFWHKEDPSVRGRESMSHGKRSSLQHHRTTTHSKVKHNHVIEWKRTRTNDLLRGRTLKLYVSSFATTIIYIYLYIFVCIECVYTHLYFPLGKFCSFQLQNPTTMRQALLRLSSYHYINSLRVSWQPTTQMATAQMYMNSLLPSYMFSRPFEVTGNAQKKRVLGPIPFNIKQIKTKNSKIIY